MNKKSQNASANSQADMHAGVTNWHTRLAGMVRCFGVGFVIVAVIAVFAVIFSLIIKRVITPPGAAELAPHLDEYLRDTGLTDVTDLNDPYRVGKLVVVDPRSRQLDTKLLKALPDDLRAAKDDEVGTIVWISWGEHLMGEYVDDSKYGSKRGKAYKGYCEITVIDRASAFIVIKRIFEAPSPPSTTTQGGDVHTEVDVAKIVQFLADLPDEPPHTLTPATTAPTLGPDSTISVRLTGPDAGIYSSSTTMDICRRIKHTPEDQYFLYYLDSYPQDDNSLVHLMFEGWQGDLPGDVEPTATTFEMEIEIGDVGKERSYVVSTTEGGSGTFLIDDQGESVTMTFTGETASGLLMAWTVRCSGLEEFGTGLIQNTPSPSDGAIGLPSAKVNVRSANLREGPGLTYAVIASLERGSLLTVRGRTDASDWFSVQVNDSGETGWISITVIELSGDPLVIPIQ